MPVVTMRQLLESGIHFGHQTRRWNPKMKKYIFGQRNGIYIIDLQQTLRQVHKAYIAVRDTVARGGTILFVGTKKQAQEPVEREAKRCGMYYINSRWLGGTLTNFRTIQSSVRTLKDLQERNESGQLDTLSKREASRLRKDMARLEKNLSGIRDMHRLPSLMFVIDTKKEHIAVREAERMGIPCIGVVDTNADPDVVPLPIPGNDDAIRAINLFCSVIADAAIEGFSLGRKSEQFRGEEPQFVAAVEAEERAEAAAVAPAPASETGSRGIAAMSQTVENELAEGVPVEPVEESAEVEQQTAQGGE